MPVRVNSLTSLERRGEIPSLKKNTVRTRERAKEQYKEEVIRSELEQLKIGEEISKVPMTSKKRVR